MFLFELERVLFFTICFYLGKYIGVHVYRFIVNKGQLNKFGRHFRVRNRIMTVCLACYFAAFINL